MKRLIAMATIGLTIAIHAPIIQALPKNFTEIETIICGEDQIHTYLHEQTDMSIKWIENTDTKATFNLGVRTPTTDSTGVNHIIEHTVFTGSKKFPSSTLFFDANANYPHTYMNASTAADYTMYPFQTPYEECFNGLLEVYLDSVLNPNMLSQPHSFYEESFYYDPETSEYAGVVFNEMKGASTQVGRVLFRTIRGAIYEGTHYQNDSGGEVAEIPKLTYQQFIDTYNNYYYPQNMMIVLYGDLDIDNTLEIIDSYLIEHIDSSKSEPVNVNVNPTLSYEDITTTYNTGGEGAYVIKSFVLPAQVNDLEILELDLWLNTYVINRNSQFKQTLQEAGMDAVEIFKDQELQNPIYSIIISQVDKNEVEQVKEILDEAINNLWEVEEDFALEQDTLKSSKLSLASQDLSQDRGLDICHSIISNWVHEKEELSYYQVKDYLHNLEDINQNVGKQLLQNANKVSIQVVPSNEIAPEINPLTLSSINQDAWQDIVTSMRMWQKAYSHKVLETTKLNKMILDTDIDYKSYTKNKINYTRFNTNVNTDLLSTEIYLETSHIEQEMLPNLFLYSYCLGQVAQEITPFQGVLKSKIVALENKKDYTPYLKMEILTTNEETNQYELLEKARTLLKEKDKEWYDLQLDKIIGEFYGDFQNDIIGTLGQLTNGAQSGYKRYIYEAHYPFYQYTIECKQDGDGEYIEKTKELIDKIAPCAGTSVAITGNEDNIKAELDIWQEYCTNNRLKKTESVEYEFIPITKDSVYYKKGQVDYLLYNYDTQKEYVEAIDYLMAAYATKNYLQPEIRIKKGAYGSGMQVKFPNTISIYTYRDPHYKTSIDIIEDMAATLSVADVEEKLRMAKSEALCDFQTQFGILGTDMKKASILHAIDLMGVNQKYITKTQKEIVKINAKQLENEIENVSEIINSSKKGVCIKKN